MQCAIVSEAREKLADSSTHWIGKFQSNAETLLKIRRPIQIIIIK